MEKERKRRKGIEGKEEKREEKEEKWREIKYPKIVMLFKQGQEREGLIVI